MRSAKYTPGTRYSSRSSVPSGATCRGTRTYQQRDRSAGAYCPRQPKSRYRGPAAHFRRNREDPHEPHHAKAGRAGSSPGHCHRGAQRILKTLSDGRLRSTAHLGCRAALAASKRVTNPCQCWASVANPSDVAGTGRQRCAATSQMTKTCDIPADAE